LNQGASTSISSSNFPFLAEPAIFCRDAPRFEAAPQANLQICYQISNFRFHFAERKFLRRLASASLHIACVGVPAALHEKRKLGERLRFTGS
jgi:hypothetical protein